MSNITEEITNRIHATLNAMVFTNKHSDEYLNCCEALSHLLDALKTSKQIDKMDQEG